MEGSIQKLTAIITSTPTSSLRLALNYNHTLSPPSIHDNRTRAKLIIHVSISLRDPTRNFVPRVSFFPISSPIYYPYIRAYTYTTVAKFRSLRGPDREDHELLLESPGNTLLARFRPLVVVIGYNKCSTDRCSGRWGEKRGRFGREPRGIYRADDRRGKKVGINGGRVQLRK